MGIVENVIAGSYNKKLKKRASVMQSEMTRRGYLEKENPGNGGNMAAE